MSSGSDVLETAPSRNEVPDATPAKKSVENGQETEADNGAKMIVHVNETEKLKIPPKADKGKLGGPVSLSQILTKSKISPPKIVAPSPTVSTSVYKPQMGNGASSCFTNSTSGIVSNSVAGSTKPIVTATSVRPSGVGLTDNASAKDVKIEQLENEVTELKTELKRRDETITKLEKEIHQLRSVLEVTHLARLGKAEEKSKETDRESNLLNPNFTKRQGVSGEPEQIRSRGAGVAQQLQIHEKDLRTQQLIKDALLENDFLKNLDTGQVKEIVDFMYPCNFEADKYVIREGDQGSHLYVLAEGELEVEQNGNKLRSMGPGKAFGELAILYNCTRTASVKAVMPSLVWALDRRVFQHVMKRTGLQRIDENLFFLKSVPLLARLSPGNLYKLASVLEQETFSAGTYIIRQGTRGDCFYIISSGKVKVTQKAADSKEEVEIRELQRGDYFGEQALLKDDVRTANIVALAPSVECLAIDRESFIQLIGDLSELKEKSYDDESSRSASQSSTTPTPSSPTHFPLEPVAEFTSVQLHELEIIATLGIGGFGRVELVQNTKDRSQCFALKCLKKQHIVSTQQQEHIYNEKVIMMSCRSPFIARLYNTFKDRKYVYMLMEPCLGGEVWSILRDRTHFDDSTAQFYTACVVEAFDYLHSKGIIYRDLKPENLLLDSHGYVKLVDFGFSKRLGVSGKTWTFCGTPEYVAPEVILNKGHDRAVDYWAIGILMYELLAGTPPFVASDPMKTYNLILRGIDQIDFPRTVGRQAVFLIKKFCRELPAERLGYQRGGIEDIRKQRWFLGFDWDGLKSKSLRPPMQPVVRGPSDAGNFDIYPRETELPPDETSGWDTDF